MDDQQFNEEFLVALMPDPTNAGGHKPISDLTDADRKVISTFLAETDFDEIMRLVGNDKLVMARLAINFAFVAHEPKASPPSTENQLRRRMQHWEQLGATEDGKRLQRLYLDYAVGSIWATLYRLGEVAREQAQAG